MEDYKIPRSLVLFRRIGRRILLCNGSSKCTFMRMKKLHYTEFGEE
jgi:hypothetical protein